MTNKVCCCSSEICRIYGCQNEPVIPQRILDAIPVRKSTPLDSNSASALTETDVRRIVFEMLKNLNLIDLTVKPYQANDTSTQVWPKP